MNKDFESLRTPESLPLDDRLREISEPNGDNFALSGAALASFVLLKLNGYVKPPLAEELSEPAGTVATGGCTCNSVCTCVPVQTCACDAVCTCDTVSQGSSCSCEGDSCYGGCSYGGGGGGYGGYWAPCF